MSEQESWETLVQCLEQSEQRWWRRFLPRWLQIRLIGDPEEQKQEYEAIRAQVRERYVELVRAIDPVLDDVAEELSPMMDSGERLPSGAEYESRLADVRQDIESFETDLRTLVTVDESPDAFLRETEHTGLSNRKERVDDFERFVEAKSTFDTRILAIEETVVHLGDIIAPYRSYDQYLTSPDQAKIETTCAELSDELAMLTRECPLERLAESDQQYVADISDAHDSIQRYIDGYNDTFIERQCAAYEELFSNIDDDGNDLNQAQRKAIVTNDVRNLVVAAAGTGKTLALTYRIAYLVAEGTDPSRVAALTFTRQAAREMETRLTERFDIDGVDVRTIHSFAYEIARDAADEYLDVVDTQDLYNLIDRVIREARNGEREQFQQYYTQFLFHYDHTHLTETDFDSRAEYVAERNAETYETLAGETVASRAERVIADFLFTHNVEYQYEAVATWAESAAEKGEYRPDFYLPEYDIYIEHWGIDENAEVAPWFSWTSAEYLQKLRWARSQFSDSEYTLLETFEFEYEAGWLEPALQHRLEHAGVELDQLSFTAFVNEAFEYNEKERDIKESLASFVHNAKTFNIDAEKARTRLSRRRPRQYYFGLCGALVLEAYNEYLERSGLVDFDDMINDATAAVQANPEPYRHQYDHVLVDEFQDVSRHQIELIRALAGQDTGPRLFCVGDDWQSIYAFQGADIQQFIAFEDHFGPTAETQLTRNYRSPQTVLEAGNDLIHNNNHQIQKTVTAARDHDWHPKLHVLDGYTSSKYEQRVGRYAVELVETFLADGHDPEDVMVLCRYDEGAEFTTRVKSALERRELPYDGKDDHYRPAGMPGEYDAAFNPDAGVAVYSVHQAKGRQAKQVIVLNVTAGKHGFPADQRENSLVAPVQDIDTATIEEERRLFYVAITRTEKQLHLLTRAGKWSPFIDEIEPYLDVEESLAHLSPERDNRTELTAKVKLIWDDLHETQHQAGVLEDATGTIRFVSWANESPPTVEEDVWYHFEDVEINEFDGDPQAVLRSATTATPLRQVGADS
ncbi:DNA helicase IV [Halalkaliarchaeum desulfuricum]|uniref:DNA 3'-5' helicase n=1 Tax=Halalkaliarchaeum desulfuricum TaxID=2055893 RepID=A0A343TL96_9EURY|nr:UvrD-helicase domain-containing protein [Halalkaliarchaeum desulfuricum]AUX09868.1 DNA helicase IV [Halalkaliarchaeum desulfuricum]